MAQQLLYSFFDNSTGVVTRGDKMILAATATASLRIVTVMDDPPVRRALREGLENRCGHQVVGEGSTGIDMVRSVLALEPDAVVFDLHLPRCPGLAALQQIYQEHPVAAVALVSWGDQDLIHRALKDYYLTYLIKPVEIQQVEPAVAVAWSRFQTLRHLAEENALLRQS